MIKYVIYASVIAFMFGFGNSLVDNTFGTTQKLEVKKTELTRLEGRFEGAVMRIDRRDRAIAALPKQCREQAQAWLKSGDIPTPFNPFGDIAGK